MMDFTKIDWTDPHAQVSKYFSVREAIWLPKWLRLANPFTDGLSNESKEALCYLFGQMDLVRDFLGHPINVHCALRPTAYNVLDGGAPNSTHIARVEQIEGGPRLLLAAVDWDADVGEETPGQNCDTIRAALMPKLEEFDLCMEDQPLGSPWVHLDTAPCPWLPHRHNRYFKP